MASHITIKWEDILDLGIHGYLGVGTRLGPAASRLYAFVASLFQCNLLTVSQLDFFRASEYN